jgi:hypothetical protein
MLTSLKTLHAVLHQWRERAATAEAIADSRGAHIVLLCAEELEEALAEAGDTPLTLTEAAAESGYTAEHLRRLVRENRIPNAGRKHAPRIRRADLPRKAGDLTPGIRPLQLDINPRVQAARRIASQGVAER